MANKNIKTGETLYSSASNRSYSIDEILAAGGATALASKLGKDPQKIAERSKALPKDAFLTNDEMTAALKVLNESK